MGRERAHDQKQSASSVRHGEGSVIAWACMSVMICLNQSHHNQIFAETFKKNINMYHGGIKGKAK